MCKTCKQVDGHSDTCVDRLEVVGEMDERLVCDLYDHGGYVGTTTAPRFAYLKAGELVEFAHRIIKQYT